MNIRNISKWILLGTLWAALAGPVNAGPNCDRKPDHPSCGGGGGGGGDTTPPADVGTIATDAINNAVTLQFTAPGDDGTNGEAARYDIRFDTDAIIDAQDFADATQAPRSAEYVPKPVGANEYWTVRDLQPGTTYYFAVQALDDAENASGIQTVTRATTPDTQIDAFWPVETVESIPESDGSGWSCCRDTNLMYTSSGAPAVGYVLSGVDGIPSSARYAVQSAPGTWNVEEIAGPEFLSNWLWDLSLSFRPDGSAESIASGGLLTGVKKGRNIEEKWGHLYAVRTGSGQWDKEVIAMGDIEANGLSDDGAALLHVEDNGAWIPTAAFVSVPEFGKGFRTDALTVAERRGGAWIRNDIFSCPNTLSNFWLARMRGPRLALDTSGRLHFLIQNQSANGEYWLLGGYRDRGSGLWSYYRTGSTTQITSHAFTFDSNDDPILAASVKLEEGYDLYLFEEDNVEKAVVDPCETPTQAAVGEVVDSHRVDNHDLSNMIDLQHFAYVRSIMRDSDGLYLATTRSEGNSEINETRLLARCANNPSIWIRDPVDRPHQKGHAALTPGGGIGWAYALGGVARGGGGQYAPRPDDATLYAERTGTPCAIAP